MDVVAAAWSADPSRPAGLDSQHSDPGLCARCAAYTESPRPVRSAVSPMFTAFDAWQEPTSALLCPSCCWAYKDHDLRRYPHRVTTAPTLEVLTLQALADQLRTPLTSEESLTVPLRPGRKHLLPEAHWGRIRTDDANLTWAPADVDRLAVLLELGRRGVRRDEFLLRTPPWRLVSATNAQTMSEATRMWDELEGWRTRPPWLALALHLLKAAP